MGSPASLILMVEAIETNALYSALLLVPASTSQRRLVKSTLFNCANLLLGNKVEAEGAADVWTRELGRASEGAGTSVGVTDRVSRWPEFIRDVSFEYNMEVAGGKDTTDGRDANAPDAPDWTSTSAPDGPYVSSMRGARPEECEQAISDMTFALCLCLMVVLDIARRTESKVTFPILSGWMMDSDGDEDVTVVLTWEEKNLRLVVSPVYVAFHYSTKFSPI